MLMIRRNILQHLRLWQLRKRRAAAVLLAVALFSILSPLPAFAGIQEYTVPAVGYGQTDEAGQAQALDYGRKRAVYLAVRKLGFGNPSDVAARIPPKDFAQIVRGATVLQYHRIGEKTYAQISVSIDDDILRKLLDVKDGPATISAQDNRQPLRNILVLPMLITPDKTFIWEKDNPLRKQLSIALLKQSHGMVILPAGDMQDLRLIDAKNAHTVTMAELKPMYDRYGADEIILAIATLSPPNTDTPTQVLLRRLSALNLPSEALEVAPDSTTDTADQRIEQTARAIATASVEIATSTSANEQAKLATSTKIKVRVDYAIPQELAHIEQAVNAAPGVLLFEMPQISLNSVSGTIYLNGDPVALRKSLTAKDIFVREKEGMWVLSVR